jgi:catechol 2,3-dioxygenase-like lactoylglutathione lyase family enzyme
MRIERVTFLTDDLEGQHQFYRQVLGLTVERADYKLLVHAGATLVEFQQGTQNWNGAYHFAFDIPENQVQSAYEQLKDQVVFFKGEDEKEIISHTGWEAHALYFRDPAGNVVELIGRHTERNASDGGFGADSILYVSEVGLPGEDVPLTVRKLQDDLELPIFDGDGSEAFTALGTSQGLIIVTALERTWYPNTGVQSSYNPVEICLVLDNGEHYQINAPPYPCEITPWLT